MVRVRERRGYLVIEAFGRRYEWTVEPRYWRNPLLAVALWLAVPPALLASGLQSHFSTVVSTLVFANMLAMVTVPYALRVVGTGRLDFGPNFFVALGGYTAALLSSRMGMQPWETLLAVVGLALAVGLLLSPAVVISRGIYFTLITFLLPFILYEVAYWRSDIFGAETGISGVAPLISVQDPYLSLLYYFYASAAVVLLYVFAVDKVFRSKYGLMIGAINEDEDVAQLYGIDVKRLKVAAFVVTSAMMAVAGWFTAHYYVSFAGTNYLSPEYLTLIFLGLVTGGRGAVYGALIGAYFAVCVNELTRQLPELASGALQALLKQELYIPRELSTVAFYAVTLSMLFLLPEGLWGLYRRRRYREYIPTIRLRRKL